jgi:hypothetical protein
MSDIDLSPPQRDLLREKLSKYCEETFDLELEQFDAEFFVDFIAKELGPQCFITPVSMRPSHPSGVERADSGRDGSEKVY